MTVTPSATLLRRFKTWSGIVAILGWAVGSLVIASNLVGIAAQFLRHGPAPQILTTLWPLGQGVLYVACAEALRRHRHESSSLDSGALEPMQRVLKTGTRIWQLLVALVLFNLGALIVLDLIHVFLGAFSG